MYAQDLKDLSKWLHQNGVSTVAMESTGQYWQNLIVELLNTGLEVILTNGKFTKNINRKKTEVLDCQWIQKMHSLGLLPSSFLPDETTEKLRTLCRYRVKKLASWLRLAPNNKISGGRTLSTEKVGKLQSQPQPESSLMKKGCMIINELGNLSQNE